eukprot:NODE_406_length_1404_cov_235.117343_g300_i0.p1 GENE.NODE_406_length_1404_cov_235.117343_g300_i0~~NODE_406_length_1404_cov_235.117343_g300_i0.p1  ORF type:complete len:408 (+),score=160.66 NODE_406_length_1404_cov_235.117343_g300_i0:99-1322(+)
MDDEEDRRINEEYKIWKKNTPFLYDLVMTHALEWPSLTVQWLPEKTVGPLSSYSTQNLLLGTHTSGAEMNYLLIAQTQLPLPKSETDARGDDSDANCGRIELLQKINHEGEVNKARYMPQNPKVVATKSVSACVNIFHTGRHPAQPEGNDCLPNMKLNGHRKEGYGLAWNPRKEGTLASGSDDALICIWDITGGLDRNTTREMHATATLSGHQDVVEDVCWHPLHDTILTSVGDDKALKIWDTRQRDQAQESVEAHAREVNAVSFNPFSQFVLATGSADKTVALWDMRHLKKKLHSFVSHEEEVFSVQWAPFNETILASSSADRRVCFWDISKIGMQQPAADEEEGPPELLFLHAGHTSKISDMSWNANQDDEWVIASVAEDNILQIWRMSESIYVDDDGADPDLAP